MHKKSKMLVLVMFLIIMLTTISCEKNETADISFNNVSVHDPAILESDGTYYITGSHMAEATSKDLINWTSISDSVNNTKLFSNIKEELKEALEWGETNTFWASDWIKLNNGKYYLYYCVCEGSSPQSAIGYAVCDNPDGPYENLGILLKSSGKGNLEFTEADGEIKQYDANYQPNTIDPAVFYDNEGKLWMMYGSYSGGIYILQLNEEDGSILPGQGTYGKKILGGFHSEIEAPYVIYSPETKYYYLFLSFGGLTADGGYNMRVCRSENPDGPYYDAVGNDMIDCKGIRGKVLAAQNEVIYAYGNKLMGNFIYPVQLNEEDSYLDPFESGYVSPGHNSVYYNKDTKEYFLLFHSRFPGQGEAHQVRVHQMYLNNDGWFVVSPYRYSGEKIADYSEKEIAGEYSYLNHGIDISDEIKEFTDIELKSNGEIVGQVDGKWKLIEGDKVYMNIQGIEYNGVVVKNYDPNSHKYVLTITVMGKDSGSAVWCIKK